MNWLAKLLTWLTKFRQKFFFTAKEHSNILEARLSPMIKQCNDTAIRRDDFKRKLNALKEEHDNLIIDYQSLQAENAERLKLINHLESQINDLMTELVPLRQTPQLDKEFHRETQIQLGRLLEGHQGFGYRNDFAIPGSMSVVTGPVSDKETLPVFGRCVVDDPTTHEINEAKTLREKYVILMNYILRFGALNRLVQALIQNGCIQFVLAYRESTTTYECFFQVNAQNFARDSTLVFDDTWGQGTVHKTEEQ